MHRVTAPHLAWAVGSHMASACLPPPRSSSAAAAREAVAAPREEPPTPSPRLDWVLGPARGIAWSRCGLGAAPYLTYAEYVALTQPEAQWLAGVVAVSVGAAVAAALGGGGCGRDEH